jgi:hypothetical protein
MDEGGGQGMSTQEKKEFAFRNAYTAEDTSDFQGASTCDSEKLP